MAEIRDGGVVFHLAGAEKGAFAKAAWTFRQGEQWAVVGPNGSGKSCLAALLAGEAPLCGCELAFGEGVEDRVAYVTFAQQQEQAAHGWLQERWHWQDAGDSLSVRKFLSFENVNEINPFEIRDHDAGARRAFACLHRRIASIFDLRSLFERQMVQLSNGEMRRVLLSRALLKNPRLLVLDDPFAGLDQAMRARLLEALDALSGQGLPMVLMVRHADEIPSCVTHMLKVRDLRIAGKRRYRRKASASRTEEGFGSGRAAEGVAGGAVSRAVSREPVVELRGVTVRYGRRVVLDKVDWTVRRGERWVVAGPNGSGKTTLLSLITGDNPAAYANDVRVFGCARVPGESLWPIRRRIGQVSPEIQCYFDPGLGCLDAVLSGRFNEEGAVLRPTRAAREAAREWLREMGLVGADRVPFGALSAGQQRLVLLARAMLPKPDLLLLDEPCLNLDTGARRSVLGVMERLLRVRREETVICVAHRRDDVPRGFKSVFDLASL